MLIVCGQGTYENGRYYTEYPDRDVYLCHAISTKEIVKAFNYTHIVCSGGFTGKATGPRISEAKSFESIWQDTGTRPAMPCYMDEVALDSAENVYLGLMEARQNLSDIPIRRIGVFAAWQFKKKRFNCLAKELGIIDHFYFHGLAWAAEAEAGDKAQKGEQDEITRIEQDKDYLLLSDFWGKETPEPIPRYCSVRRSTCQLADEIPSGLQCSCQPAGQ